MNFHMILTIWLSVYVAFVILDTITTDPKLNRRKVRFYIALCTMWLWPALVLVAPIYMINEYHTRNHELETKKVSMLFLYLMMNGPNYRDSKTDKHVERKFVESYLAINYPEGLLMIKNPKVYNTEMAQWILDNVKIELHDRGLCRGVCEWYTRNS